MQDLQHGLNKTPNSVKRYKEIFILKDNIKYIDRIVYIQYGIFDFNITEMKNILNINILFVILKL